jgi:rare lipoprotein A
MRGMKPPTLRLVKLGVVVSAAALLTACATGGTDFSRYPTKTAAKGEPTSGLPQTQGRRQVGKPYEINGVWYTPQEDPDYNEVGLASWYGGYHQGRKTANGETFDVGLLTAAHKTLPLPSIVEVTNLDNGRSMRLRVNDRGPFVEGRIIDLSQAAAEELGVIRSGVARVRVRYVGPAPLNYAETRVASRDPEPRAVPQAATKSSYEVQVGAFSVRANAERAADLVSGAGRAEIRPVDNNGLTFWRVVVSPISDASQAAAVRDRVIDSGFADARVAGPF